MTRAQSTVFRRNSPAVAVGCPVVKLPRCYKRENKMKPKVLFAMTFAAALLAVSTAASAAVTISEFPLPSASSAPYGITAGSDGNLWFTQINANKIGRITTH